MPRPDIANAKRRWNSLNVWCRSIPRSVRNGFCSHWSNLWNTLRSKSPGKMWTTFKNFTSTRGEEICCSPDEQWHHWAGQADITGQVWTDSVCIGAAAFVFRETPASATVLAPISHEEVKTSRSRVSRSVVAVLLDTMVFLLASGATYHACYSWQTFFSMGSGDQRHTRPHGAYIQYDRS